MANLFVPPLTQFFGTDNLPLAGGKVYTYLTGTSTSTPSYTDATASTANANPVILDSYGRAGIYLPSRAVGGSTNLTYRIVVKTSADVTISTTDGITVAVEYASLSIAANIDLLTYSLVSNNNDIDLDPHGTGETRLYALACDTLYASTYNLNMTTAKSLTVSGNPVINLNSVASGVNYPQVYSSVTGSPVKVAAIGSDTNVDIKVLPKGTGVLYVTSSTYVDNVTDDDDIPNLEYVSDNYLPLTPTLDMYILTKLNFKVIAGTPTITTNANISSITDVSVGRFTFNYTQAYGTDLGLPSFIGNEAAYFYRFTAISTGSASITTGTATYGVNAVLVTADPITTDCTFIVVGNY